MDARLDSILNSWCFESKLLIILGPVPLRGVSGGVIDCDESLLSVNCEEKDDFLLPPADEVFRGRGKAVYVPAVLP